jgi:(1->4)-alpha-D-glucan 1-alpha-D-glucosylmutase
MDDAARADFVSRITAYMIKATREARQRNSWAKPNQQYEKAIAGVVSSLIDPDAGARFLKDFLPFQKMISRLGMLNSLAQTVIRLTAPGVCDTYQGTEIWDFSLVDPDNRRPVDYRKRKSMLEKVSKLNFVRDFEDERAKLFVTQKLLHHRRQFPSLYLNGDYVPIRPVGSFCENLFSFSRIFENQISLVASLPQNNQWLDTRFAVPAQCKSTQLVNLLTGALLAIRVNGEIDAADLFRDFPIAVFTSLQN